MSKEMNPSLLQSLLATYEQEIQSMTDEQLRFDIDLHEHFATGQAEGITYREGDIPYYQGCTALAQELLNAREEQAREDAERMNRGN